MTVFEGAAMQEKDKMSFNWQNNSGMGNAEDTDIAMLLVYNKDKEMAVYDTEAALRSGKHAELLLPDNWQDDELVAYLSFRNADGESVSNSICLPISIAEAPEDEGEIQAESTDTTNEKPLPIKKTKLQPHIAVHLSSASPNNIGTCRCET